MSDTILPFYLVCDEAKSGRAGIQTLNDALRKMHADMRSNSSLAGRTRFCLLGFGGSVRVVRTLADMNSAVGMPRLKEDLTSGPSSYAAVFDLLYDTINKGFAASNWQFHRPAVFFLAGTMVGPSLGQVDEWSPAYQRLTDPSWPWRPRIVSFGVDARTQSLQQIATVRAFSLDGSLTQDRALREVVQALSRSMIESSRAQAADGGVQFVAPERVTGFNTLPAGVAVGTSSAGSAPSKGAAAAPSQSAGLRALPSLVSATTLELARSPETPVTTAAKAPAIAAGDPAPGSPPPSRTQGDADKPVSPPPPAAQSSGHAPDAAQTAAGTAGAAGTAFPDAPAFGRQAPVARSPLNGLPGGPQRVPDTVLDGADLKGLAVRGASLRGDAHRDKGVTRQDAMGIYAVTAGGIEAVLGCVADGKDGEPLSHLGAEQACLLLRDEVAARLPDLFGVDADGDVPAVCQDIAESVAARLAQRAGFLKASPRALSTTLAAAVVEAGGTARPRRAVVFAIGRGTGLLMDKGKLMPCIAASRDGDEPAELPAHVGHVAAVVRNLPKGTALLLCTPGLSKPLIQPEVRDQFLDWWTGDLVPTLPEFAWQLSFRAKSGDEDRTAVCFWAR